MIRLTLAGGNLRSASERFLTALNREAGQAFRQSGEEFVGTMQSSRFRGYDGNKGDLIANRSKRLKGSFGYVVQGGIGQPFGLQLIAYSSGVLYARLQEKGGTVRPKNKQNLTIPLTDALTGAGVPRYPGAGWLFEHYPGQLFVAKTRSGKVLIGSHGKPGTNPQIPKLKLKLKRLRAKTAGRPPPSSSSEVLWLYLLRKEVTIPPRLGFESTWRGLADKRSVRIGNAFRRAALEFK